jgi:F-box protein 11
MLSATGITAALAILAISVNVIDSDPGPDPAVPGQTEPAHVVAADGSGDFETIQSAVDAAAAGDMIVILPGTYEESVLVDRDLTISGDAGNPAAVVVRIPDDGPTVDFKGVDLGYGFLFDGVTAEISHLTISGPGAGVSALVATDGDLTAHDLVEDLDPYVDDPYGFLYVGGDTTGDIYANSAKALVLFDEQAQPTFRENDVANVIRILARAFPRVEDNAVGGIWLHGTGAPLVENNTIDFANNGAGDGGSGSCGIEVSPGVKLPTIIRNRVRNAPTGICVDSATAVTVTQNDIEVDVVGIDLYRADVSVRHNSISGDGDGIVVSGRNPSWIEANSVDVAGQGLLILSPASPWVSGNDFCGD